MVSRATVSRKSAAWARKAAGQKVTETALPDRTERGAVPGHDHPDAVPTAASAPVAGTGGQIRGGARAHIGHYGAGDAPVPACAASRHRSPASLLPRVH